MGFKANRQSGFLAGLVTKTLRVMKITAFFLLVACLHVSAKTFSQEKITISGHNRTFRSITKEIARKLGYQFFFADDFADSIRSIDISVHNASLEEVLDICLKGKPYSYQILNKIVVLNKSGVGVHSEAIGPVKTVRVQGDVYNEDGQPLSGADVVIKETRKGTTTNAKGEFSLNAVPINSVLVFSFIGFAPQELQIKDETNAKIYLKIAKNELDKVVIQAYGTTTERLNTGNISTVSSEQIERQPVMNPIAALEGQVPGLVVTETSGYASAPIKVEIRGRSVIDPSQLSDPLYIIDGVPVTVLNLGNGGNYSSGSTGFIQSGINGPAGGQSPFFSINPSDIESITVLKDADATAIYGSRGANGVIILTTKSGKPGKTKFTMNVYQGTNEITGKYNLLSTSQYLEMRREAFKNDQADYGLSSSTIPNSGNAYDLLTWDTTSQTNWQKVLWGHMGHTTDADLSLSGGDKQNTFRLGSSVHQETSILTKSGADTRASEQFNYNHNSLDEKLKVSFSNTFSYTESNLKNIGGSVLETPNAPSIFNSDGTLNWNGWQPVPGNLSNWGALLQPYNARTDFLNSQLKLEYKFFSGFSFGVQGGYSLMHNSQTFLIPITSQNPFSNPLGRSSFGNTNITNTIIEPTLEYKFRVGEGKIDLLAGASDQYVTSDMLNAGGSGYINDNLLSSLYSAPQRTVTNGTGQYRYGAAYGRINYNWKDEIILNLSARRDGSSRFGPGRQYGNFGAVGVAWIFTEINWIKEKFPVLSFGKIRGSYGLTGNDAIPDYDYLTQWSAGGNIPYQGNVALVPIQHANPDLHWETNYKLEGAIDIGLFRDRLLINASWYRNRCGDQLVSEPLPIITGFSQVETNLPATIQNTGLEFTVKGKLISNKDFSISATFNIGANRNKLVSYPNLSQSPYASSYVIGQSLGIVKLLHYTGVDPQTGQYTYEDKNHNGILDYNPYDTINDFYNKDLTVKFDGGFSIDMQYKHFKADLFFVFRKQLLPSGDFNGVPGTIELNQSSAVLNRWQKPGDHSAFARYTTQPQLSDILYQSSDAAYTDGSFIRLRNVSLSYDLNLGSRSSVERYNCTLFLRGQNLFFLTRYNGIDPEAPFLGTLPLAKVFTGGIQLSF
jgi:TonB-linked SusC/RagA family outer membrane protein